MRADLLGPKVENVALALVELPIKDADPEYIVFLINNREDIMEGIIVASTGYGENPTTGEQIKTSTLRKGIEVMMPLTININRNCTLIPRIIIMPWNITVTSPIINHNIIVEN